MPVATLILICPGIEVKPVKGDALGADRDGRYEGANLSIETVFVHAEVDRGIAQPDESRHERDRRAVMEHPSRGGGGCEVLIVFQRPSRTCGTGRSETSCHWVGSIRQIRKRGMGGFAENSAERHLPAGMWCAYEPCTWTTRNLAISRPRGSESFCRGRGAVYGVRQSNGGSGGIQPAVPAK